MNPIKPVIHFTSLNKIPLFLIIISLIIRVAGDFIPAQPLYSSLGHIWSSSLRMTYFLGLSCWLIVAAMSSFCYTLWTVSMVVIGEAAATDVTAIAAKGKNNFCCEVRARQRQP